jgi:hypothetical protein
MGKAGTVASPSEYSTIRGHREDVSSLGYAEIVLSGEREVTVARVSWTGNDAVETGDRRCPNPAESAATTSAVKSKRRSSALNRMI